MKLDPDQQLAVFAILCILIGFVLCGVLAYIVIHLVH